MPLLSPGSMHNQSGSKLVGGFFGSWVRESGKEIHTVSKILASPSSVGSVESPLIFK